MSESSRTGPPSGGQRKSSRPWWACILGISVLAGGVGFVAASLGTRDQPEPSEGVPASVAVPLRGQENKSPQGRMDRVALYYIGKNDGLLYREFRDLPARGARSSTAVLSLTEVAPLDPDYVGLWSPAAWVQITETAGTVSVDLPADAFRNVDSPEKAQRALAQLSSTLIDSMEERSQGLQLKLLVDGSPTLPEVFGQASLKSTAAAALKPALWLTEPVNQSMLPEGRIRIAGVVRPGSPKPEVVAKETRSGRVVRPEVEVLGPQGSDWNGWETEIEASAGIYEITASSGRGSEASTDSKVLKVAAAGQ